MSPHFIFNHAEALDIRATGMPAAPVHGGRSQRGA